MTKFSSFLSLFRAIWYRQIIECAARGRGDQHPIGQHLWHGQRVDGIQELSAGDECFEGEQLAEIGHGVTNTNNNESKRIVPFSRQNE